MQHIDLRNIKINQIQIFLEAVNCGSFSGAAEALHVTQPMVSKTIQALEKELGIILFIRSKGKLNLTPAGRDCYNQWSNMLKYLEASVESAHAIQEGASSRLHIGAGSMAIKVGNFFPLLKEFKEQHPVKYVVENIDRAIEHKWIKVYYQPVIRSLTGALCSMESLTRWDDPEIGFLMPKQFIRPLEKSHQIYKVDCFVVEQVCADILIAFCWENR